MAKVNHLETEDSRVHSQHKLETASRDRLDVNDLLNKRKKEKQLDRKTNVVIFSGATAAAAIIFLILYF